MASCYVDALTFLEYLASSCREADRVSCWCSRISTTSVINCGQRVYINLRGSVLTQIALVYRLDKQRGEIRFKFTT